MIPPSARIVLATQPIDFRKRPDGLTALVRDAGVDPFSGALFVLRAKRADRVKILWWDGTGLCLFSKRLERVTGFIGRSWRQARFDFRRRNSRRSSKAWTGRVCAQRDSPGH